MNAFSDTLPAPAIAAPRFVLAPQSADPDPLEALVRYEQGLLKLQLEAIKQAEQEAQTAIAQAKAKYQSDLQAIQSASEERLIPLEAARAELAVTLNKRDEAKVMAKRIWAAVNDLGQDASEARERIRSTFQNIRAVIRVAEESLRQEQDLYEAGQQVDQSEREFVQRVYEDAVNAANEKADAIKKKYNLAAEILQAEGTLLNRISQATTKAELDQLKAEATELGLDIVAPIRARRETLRTSFLGQLSQARQPREIDRVLAAAKAAGELHHVEGPAARQRRQLLKQGWIEAQSFAENLASYSDQVDKQITVGNQIGYWPGNVWVYAPQGQQWQVVRKYVYKVTPEGGAWIRLRMTGKVIVTELPKNSIEIQANGLKSRQSN
jgi:hypothetical protein